MKPFFIVFCILLICSVPVMGYCNESYGAHFEVKVVNEAGRDTGASGPLDIVSGVPHIFDLGDKILELLFVIEPSPSIDYSLTVSLSPNPESSHASTISLSSKGTSGFVSNIPRLSQTFHSKLVGGQNGPLEFEMEQNGFKVSGAVAVSLIKNGPTN